MDQDNRFKNRVSLLPAFLIGILCVGISGGGTWYVMNQRANKSDNTVGELNKKIEDLENKIGEEAKDAVEPLPTTEKESANELTKDTNVYTNNQFGFELTFLESWKDYGVSESSGVNYAGQSTSVKEIVFGLPREEPSKIYNDGFKNKYTSIFSIDIFYKDQWDKAQKSEGPKPNKIAENSKYVFAYSTGNDIPESISISADQVYSDIESIIKTFKVLN